MDVDKELPSNPKQYVERQEAEASEDLSQWWQRLHSAYDRKLWHNITLLLLDFIARPDCGPYLIELFTSFVRPIEGNLNPLKLVEISRRVAREYTDPTASLAFLESVHSRLPNPEPEDKEDVGLVKPPPRPAADAYALSHTSIAYAQLLIGNLESSKASLDACEKILSELDSVDPAVNAGFYGVSADYFKVKADYVSFYKSSLLFLACVDIDVDLSGTERISRAHDLSIAALLGETIYNFGELLQHPLLLSLDGTSFEWIKQLLYVFNAGDIGKFESASHKLSEEPILASDSDFLRQKICLMALIEAVFKRPRSQRSMTFEAVAQETKLPLYEVEHLVMKALSLNLIKGSLDQVNGVADIHWVQPRVLDAEQTRALSSRLGEWCTKVGELGEMVGSYKQPLSI